ncbi:MAG: hypothetical protein IT542_07100, partial [Rubellimicrobium sp.]|nr:hypothetical protein [Rubellimicrobium sp.]
ISQVATITQAGAPPTEMRRITLLPGAAGPVPAALTATGYHEEPSDRGRLFAAGASEFAIDLGARRDDPFGGMLGRSSRILIEGDTLLQAAGMGPVMALSGGASWAARPDMAAILDALSSWPADPPGAAAWVNAHVLLRQSDLAPMPDIALLLDGAARPEPAPGVPFWSVCVIALLVGEGGTSSAIAIPYATREQAEAAARSALQGWQMPGPGGEGAKSATIGPLETRITGTGPFVMIAAVSGGAGWADAPRDIPYWQILRALWNRDLGEFGPPA